MKYDPFAALQYSHALGILLAVVGAIILIGMAVDLALWRKGY